MSVTREFIIAVKLHPQPAYKIAQEAGIDPCVLSKILSGYIQVVPGDERVLGLAHVLGLDPGNCFDLSGVE